MEGHRIPLIVDIAESRSAAVLSGTGLRGTGEALPQCDSLSRDLLSQIKVKPRVAEPQDSWGSEIAGYLYLGGLGAGSFALAVVLGWLGWGLAPAVGGPADRVWDWSAALVLWGPLVTAFGAALLILHLGRNWFLFLTAGRNPRTSWLARGFGVLSAFILVATAVLAVAVFVPQWAHGHLVLWRLLETVGALTALGTALYTGVLLQSMSYIPAWGVTLAPFARLPLLPFLFLASALSTGAMGLVVGAEVYHLLAQETASASELVHALEVVEPILIAWEAVLLALYVRNLQTGKPEGRLSAQMWLSGSWRYGFWVGIVGLALLVPFVLDLVNLVANSGPVTALAAASVLLGGFVLRLGVLSIGIKETPPLYKLSKWRRQDVLSAS